MYKIQNFKSMLIILCFISIVFMSGSILNAKHIEIDQNQIYGYDEDGTMFQEQFVEINGEYYYFTEDGCALVSTWKKNNGDYYYFGEDGKALKGVHYLGVQYFGFSQDGIRLHGYHEINNKRYFFNTMGASVRSLLNHDGETLFIYGNGNFARNRFFKKNGNIYVFNKNGYMVKNQMYDASHIKNRDVYKVYCDQNGVIQEGFIEYQDHTYYMSLSEDTGYLRGLHQINDKTYYFNNEGYLVRDEWININNDLYYFNQDGCLYRNQLATVDSKLYYFDEEGKVVTGYLSLALNGEVKHFYFDEQGVSQTGMIQVPQSETIRYFNGDGSVLRSEFINVDNNTYFFMKDGTLCKSNWRNIGVSDLNGSSFYIHCNEEGVVQQGPMYITRDDNTAFYYMDISAEKGFRTGIQEVNGKYYGFSEASGKALKGVKIIGKNIYYFQADCTMYQDGWITIGNKHYYFSEDGTGYYNQLVTINDNPYYFTSSGYVATGYRTVTMNEEKLYFFYDEYGISLKGLIPVPNTTYSRYFNGDGTILVSQFYEIDNQLYFFTSSGILFVGDWRNAGNYDLNQEDLYIHTDENGVVAQGYCEFERDGKEVVYYFDRTVKYGHRLGLVDCGERGIFYFQKSKTYGFVAKGFFSDPETNKTYAFDEQSGALLTSGQLNIAGTNLVYPVLTDGTLDLSQPILPEDDLGTRFVKLGISELYKKYSHDSFTEMEYKNLAEIDGYSCSGFVIRLLYELHGRVDYFARNHDLVYQAYCNRENGDNMKVWSKDYPVENLIAGDLVVINKYDCYSDVDDVGDLTLIDLNEDGICDREHKPFLGNDGKIIELHVHHIGIYLGDGYYLNSIPSKGVCVQKIPEKTEFTEVSAYARVLS